MKNNYYVYIMASQSGTIYTGMTNNLERRVFEHKQELIEGFTKKYQCKKLVYYETLFSIKETIKREKSLKGLSRKKKENLINAVNPHWKDLSENWV